MAASIGLSAAVEQGLAWARNRGHLVGGSVLVDVMTEADLPEPKPSWWKRLLKLWVIVAALKP